MWRIFALSCFAFALTLSQLSAEETSKTAHMTHGEASSSDSEKGKEGHHNASTGHHVERYAVAHFDWNHVKDPFMIAIWILLACIAKIGFNMSKKFSSIFPDSSLLIVLGLVVGVILYVSNTSENTYKLSSDVFFLFLLPPIVLDAGWFMPTRAFFDNLGTILTYAVIGTIWNASTIGLSLWAVGRAGMFSLATPLLHILLFASLIAAVDPVAVLVVFEEIHVNEILFISVFGESLLNDGVAVVLYHVFSSFSEIGAENLIPIDFVMGFASFFVIALGGVGIGLLWAVLVSFLTRWTKQVRILEPLYALCFAYCSYLTAEMFHLSGILAIVTCGLAMKQYVVQNISKQSAITINYFLKMLSTSSETIIFMFLGLSTVSTDHHWDTAFVGLTLLFCLVYRAVGVVLQTYFVNKNRLHKFSKVDQFIMAYGGLRGAIAYGLAVQLEDVIIARKMFLTACVVVIYFTVFLQGMTIKPLVNFLKVKKEEHRQKKMTEHIVERTADHMVSCVELILGHNGHHAFRSKWNYFNERYLMPILMSNPPKGADHGLVDAYTEMNMKEAEEHMNKYGTVHANLSQLGSRTASTLTLNAGGGGYTNPAFVIEDDHLAVPRINLPPRYDNERSARSISVTEEIPKIPRHLEQKQFVSPYRLHDRNVSHPVTFGLHPHDSDESVSDDGLVRYPKRKLTLAESQLPWKHISETPPLIRRGSIHLPDVGAVPNGSIVSQVPHPQYPPPPTTNRVPPNTGPPPFVGTPAEEAEGGLGAPLGNAPHKYFTAEEDSPPPSYREVEESESLNSEDGDQSSLKGIILNHTHDEKKKRPKPKVMPKPKQKEIIDVEGLRHLENGSLRERTPRDPQRLENENVTTVYL